MKLPFRDATSLVHHNQCILLRFMCFSSGSKDAFAGTVYLRFHSTT